MSLTLADVERIAHLARIRISQEESERTLAQLNDIFSMIAQIQAVDTGDLEPMAHPLGGAQRLRDDLVTGRVNRDVQLRNAPSTHEGLFLVPRVVE